MIVLVILLSLLVTGSGYIAHVGYRRRTLLARSWEDMLASLRPVDLDGVRSIADCYLQPNSDQLRIEPDAMWKIVGGLKGIECMRANARIMLDLAVFAERWDTERGPVISEMIRRDAVRLNSAVLRIELASLFHFSFAQAPFHLQEAASSYYLIRSRLLAFYQVSHSGLLPRLQAAI